MINPELLRAYKVARGYSVDATRALARARDLINKAGKRYYCDAWPWARGLHNVSIQPPRPIPHNNERYAWIENPKTAGLRFVGFADKLGACDHQGWYINTHGDSLYRGAVWQLPARNGRARYVAGYVESENMGSAFVNLDIIEGEKIGSSYDTKSDARDAAFVADSIARIYAEQAREYNEQWQHGQQWESLGEEIASERKSLLALLSEFRPLRKAGEIHAPIICRRLRSDIDATMRNLRNLREERQEIFDEWSHTDGFAEFLPRAAS